MGCCEPNNNKQVQQADDLLETYDVAAEPQSDSLEELFKKQQLAMLKQNKSNENIVPEILQIATQPPLEAVGIE